MEHRQYDRRGDFNRLKLQKVKNSRRLRVPGTKKLKISQKMLNAGSEIFHRGYSWVVFVDKIEHIRDMQI